MYRLTIFITYCKYVHACLIVFNVRAVLAIYLESDFGTQSLQTYAIRV